ncbi:MAG: PDDEXK family nuclease [Saccharofermentanales bacterium]
MRNIKAIQTQYKGYLFRSRLEARWAVFFDACGVEYEYEPEGYDLGNGLMYLPDFLLHGVDGRDGGDIFVEVKGQMTDGDAKKINRFAQLGMENPDQYGKSETAILVVGKIPEGNNINEITQYISNNAYNDYGNWPNVFNFETIDGDYFAAHPGINQDGKFELFGDDSSYLSSMNPAATERAYRLARHARFEHGQTPRGGY